jgi:hypothetical protein
MFLIAMAVNLFLQYVTDYSGSGGTGCQGAVSSDGGCMSSQ